jgi:hypothetical protein
VVPPQSWAKGGVRGAVMDERREIKMRTTIQ